MQNWGEQLGLFGSEKRSFKPLTEVIKQIEKQALRIARSRGFDVKTVKWKNNRRVMASVGKGKVLNLHTIYQKAKKDDLVILANVMKGTARTADYERFKQYIQDHLPKGLEEGPSRLIVLPPKGLFHDLNKALKVVLPLLPKPPDPMPHVGWSPVRVGDGGITWGTHRDGQDGSLILVNAVLDAHDIPAYVVEHIVWHEICHDVLPPENGSNGRRRVHSKAFREMEHMYPKAKLAEQWELKNVTMLIKRHKPRRKNRSRKR
jgi:hypothetical protein